MTRFIASKKGWIGRRSMYADGMGRSANSNPLGLPHSVALPLTSVLTSRPEFRCSHIPMLTQEPRPAR